MNKKEHLKSEMKFKKKIGNIIGLIILGFVVNEFEFVRFFAFRAI